MSEFEAEVPETQPELSMSVFSSHDTVESVLESLPLTQRPLITSLAGPKSKVELVYIDEDPFRKPAVRPSGTFGPLPMRNGYDKLLYGTGMAYLGGLTYGSTYGFIRGLRTAQVPNFTVRMNSIVNQMTRYGPWSANSLGVMTMSWALLDNLAHTVRGTSDYYNHVGAAFVTGFVFKSTAGLRPAFFMGSILSGVVGSYAAFEKINAKP